MKVAEIQQVIDDRITVPKTIGEKIREFLVDKRTGNVVLNIRDGQIMKAELQEHVKA